MGNLTQKQLELFPDLLSGYLQRNGQKGLTILIPAMSEMTKGNLYQICEEDFMKLLSSQAKQLKDAKDG